MPKRAKDSNTRELFHAAAVTSGGERSCISAGVSLSTTTIGPAHLGQSQRSVEFLVLEVSCAVCGAEPSNEKQRGNHAWRTARQMLHYGSEELFASRVDHKFERSLHGTILIGGDCVSLLREPDAANPHVRFDERGVETDAWRG